MNVMTLLHRLSLKTNRCRLATQTPMAIRAHEHVNLDAKRKAMNTLAATLAL